MKTLMDLEQFKAKKIWETNTLWNNRIIQYTDGIKYLYRNFECYWLLTAIGSHRNTIATDEHESFGIWLLTVAEDNSAVLTFGGKSGEPLIRQEIPFTDFLTHCNINPLKLYQCYGVLMLPSEY